MSGPGLFQGLGNPAPEIRKLLVVMVVAGLLCRLTFVFFTPVFYAPDEESHYNYVRYLVEHKAFPVQTSKLGDTGSEFEYNQPPLYYLILTPCFGLAQGVFHSVTVTVILLRLVSVLFWGLNVWLATVWLKRLEIKDSFVWVFGLGMICLLPTYLFISSVINNDNLVAVLGSGLLVLLAGQRRTPKSALATGLLLGLALVAKQSAVVFAPAIVVLAVFDGIQKRVKWGEVLVRLGLISGMAALVSGPWMLRNFRVYGTFTPEYLVGLLIAWPSWFYGLASAGHNLVKSFWAVSGVTNNISYPFPLVGMLLMGLCVLARGGMSGMRDMKDSKLGPNGAMMTALLIASFVNVGLVLRFGYLYAMGQGRHLFALLLPIGLIMAWGLQPLPIPNPAVQAARFWLAYGVSFTAFSLIGFP